ncbi:MAG: hypothetical protein ACI4EA_08790 [Candidatus Ornithomonoglobus sp.]
MNQLHGSRAYIENSIATSRTFQEIASIAKGNTVYGTLAALINSQTDKLDKAAECMGEYVTYIVSEKAFKYQYGGRIKSSFNQAFERKDDKIRKQEFRQELGFWSGFAAETVLKIIPRVIQQWADEKNKYAFYEQIYSLLYCFSHDDSILTTEWRVNAELKKILNSFMLKEKDKRILLNTVKPNNPRAVDLSLVLSDGNNAVIDHITYLLYVLFAQKYEQDESAEHKLLNYYHMLGLNSAYSTELLEEQKEKYNRIAVDQISYLNIAKGMVQNFAPSLPTIDIQALYNRADIMSTYNPYLLRHNNNQQKPKPKKRLAEIFLEKPDMVTHAGTVALSQLDLDDNGKENIVKQMDEWGLDDEYTKDIIDQSSNIQDASEVNEY